MAKSGVEGGEEARRDTGGPGPLTGTACTEGSDDVS